MNFLNARIDFVGLADEPKPTTEIKNGSTFYTVDTKTLYIFYEGVWYDQTPES